MNIQVTFFLEGEHLETLTGVPSIPRIGEKIMIRDEYAIVRDVVHDFEIGESMQYVQIHMVWK